MQQTVMIVDDSIPVHILVKNQLGQEKLKFHSVYDGVSAMSAAADMQPSLILMDVDMPRADGFEACRFIKSNPLTAAIPLIFVSGNSLVGHKVKGLDLGAVDYITKPFKPDELRARVRSALRVRPASPDGHTALGVAGLWTQVYFESQIKSLIAQSRRSGRPLSCVVAEMDRWDRLSSRLGPRTMNEINRTVARAFILRCRADDSLFHFTEGKFAFLLNDANRAQAGRLCDRLRSDVAQQFTSANHTGFDVTLSFGIADTLIAEGDTLLDRAEIALGRAKRRGGNRTTIARDRTIPAIAA